MTRQGQDRAALRAAATSTTGKSIAVEWWFRPFAADPSLGFFLAHLGDLPHNSLISLGVVAVLGLYFGVGRRQKDGDPS